MPVKGLPEFGYFFSGIFIHIDFQKKILAALSVQILDDVLRCRPCSDFSSSEVEASDINCLKTDSQQTAKKRNINQNQSQEPFSLFRRSNKQRQSDVRMKRLSFADFLRVRVSLQRVQVNAVNEGAEL